MNKNLLLFFIISILSLSCSNTTNKLVTMTKNIEVKFDLCNFPNSIKTPIESKLKIKCHKIKEKDLIKVETLKIQNISSDIKNIHKNIGFNFKNLKTLDLSNDQKLTAIPNFVYRISNLEQLDISNTKITNFSAKLCKLTKLKTLKASHNSYEDHEIPIAVFCLNNLKVLDMSYSGIHYIDEYLFYLKNLEEFYLRGNNLMLAPMTLHLLPKLMVLDLRDNKFKLKSVNSLYNCKNKLTEEEKKICTQEFKASIDCEHRYKFAFNRGSSFRERYTQMTGSPHIFRENDHIQNQCYNFWLSDYVTYHDPSKKYLLDLTENGKTIREYRLAMKALILYSPNFRTCGFASKGISIKNNGIMSSIANAFGPKNTNYLLSMAEYRPAQYRTAYWPKPKACSPINYEAPHKPVGSWIKALPEVQKAIYKNYPDLIHCKQWISARCPYNLKAQYTDGNVSMEYIYLGSHSLGISRKTPITDYYKFTNKKMVNNLTKRLKAEEVITTKPEILEMQYIINIEKAYDIYMDPE